MTGTQPLRTILDTSASIAGVAVKLLLEASAHFAVAVPTGLALSNSPELWTKGEGEHLQVWSLVDGDGHERVALETLRYESDEPGAVFITGMKLLMPPRYEDDALLYRLSV